MGNVKVVDDKGFMYLKILQTLVCGVTIRTLCQINSLSFSILSRRKGYKCLQSPLYNYTKDTDLSSFQSRPLATRHQHLLLCRKRHQKTVE